MRSSGPWHGRPGWRWQRSHPMPAMPPWRPRRARLPRASSSPPARRNRVRTGPGATARTSTPLGGHLVVQAFGEALYVRLRRLRSWPVRGRPASRGLIRTERFRHGRALAIRRPIAWVSCADGGDVDRRSVASSSAAAISMNGAGGAEPGGQHRQADVEMRSDSSTSALTPAGIGQVDRVATWDSHAVGCASSVRGQLMQ